MLRKQPFPSHMLSCRCAISAGIVSQAARKKIAERERQREADDAKPEMSGAQAAEAKRSMAAIMLPKETVSRAMKRLRPPGDCLILLARCMLHVMMFRRVHLQQGSLLHSAGLRCHLGHALAHGASTPRLPCADCQLRLVCCATAASKGRGAKHKADAAGASAAGSAEAQQYQKLKAGADALMDSGEMDVYGLSKEDLERGAALYAPAVCPCLVRWRHMKCMHLCPINPEQLRCFSGGPVMYRQPITA